MHSRGHIPERLVDQRKPMQVKCIMVFSVNQKGEIFTCGKSVDESSFGFSRLALYIDSDH